MKEEGNKVGLLSYVFIVFLTGVVSLVYMLLKYRNISLLGVLIFGILIFTSDNLSAPLPKTGSVSVNFGISLASLVIFGPATAILVTFISIFNIKEIVRRVPYYKHLFNAGQYLFSFAAAAIFFEYFYDRSQTNFFYARNIWVIFLVTYIFFILNTTLTAAAISLSSGINIINVWIFNFAWIVPFQFFLSAMAIAIAFLYLRYSPFTLIFTSLPLIIAQYVYLLRIKERRTILNSIMQIVKIIEAKDIYTAGHSIRVADYSESLARGLRLNEYDIEVVRNLASLHDIGKIQIDLSILNKTAKLSEKDWNEIKKHSIVSYEVIKQIDFLKDRATSVLYHHEKVDGSGYPFGKKEEEIPLFAKILCVADSYDAMTTDRPYRRALTPEETISELENNKGGQFDASVCSAMIDIIKQVEISKKALDQPA
ncbi:MAG: HD-GYP domain-containing protein [Actinobacteria bacterium]|nr:HD-GYP domain-containing protein [Actinomycetota bacterium]